MYLLSCFYFIFKFIMFTHVCMCAHGLRKACHSLECSMHGDLELRNNKQSLYYNHVAAGRSFTQNAGDSLCIRIRLLRYRRVSCAAQEYQLAAYLANPIQFLLLLIFRRADSLSLRLFCQTLRTKESKQAK